MTLPDERFNAVNQTRAFLRDLLDPKKTPGIPKATRKQAYWCLKHFPLEFDMDLAALDAPEIFGKKKKKADI